jgi:hypothetical protein
VALGGWPVRLTGAPPSGEGPRGLALTIDLAASIVSGWTEVAVQAIAVDGAGTVRAGRRIGGPVASLPRVEGRWVRLETRLALPAGRYEVRVVAARGDAAAEARTAADVGSVFAYVSVP